MSLNLRKGSFEYMGNTNTKAHVQGVCRLDPLVWKHSFIEMYSLTSAVLSRAVVSYCQRMSRLVTVNDLGVDLPPYGCLLGC